MPAPDTVGAALPTTALPTGRDRSGSPGPVTHPGPASLARIRVKGKRVGTQVSVVLPAYNERDNLAELVPEATAALRAGRA